VDAPIKRRFSAKQKTIAFFAALPLVYALSFGPAFCIIIDFAPPASRGTWLTLYAPLMRTAFSDSFAGKFLRAYLEFWGSGELRRVDKK